MFIRKELSSKSIQGSILSLESIHNIHSGDSHPLGVFSVGDRISDHILQKNLQNTTGLLEIRLTPPRRAKRLMAGLVIT